MWNLSYTACSFVLNKKYKKEEKVDLWGEFVSTSGEEKVYKNFFALLKKYFSNHSDLKDVTTEKRLFKMKLIEEGECEKIKYLLIEIDSGRYGFKSSITDKNTKEIAYQQKETDAPLMKFYLTIILPKVVKDKKIYKGFMFFQNYGQFGVKTDTINNLRQFLTDEFSVSIWVGNISPEIFVDVMLKSENIKKISFVRNNISRDKTDNIQFTYGKEQRVIEKISFTESFMSRIKGYLAGSNRIFEFENKEYSDVKVNVDVGGRVRTIGLNNIENISVIESLPDDLKNIDGDIDTSRLVEIVCKQTEEYMKKVIYCI